MNNGSNAHETGAKYSFPGVTAAAIACVSDPKFWIAVARQVVRGNMISVREEFIVRTDLEIASGLIEIASLPRLKGLTVRKLMDSERESWFLGACTAPRRLVFASMQMMEHVCSVPILMMFDEGRKVWGVEAVALAYDPGGVARLTTMLFFS